MPSSVGSALLIFGAVLTSVSAEAGSAVAGVGVLWEGFVFTRASGFRITFFRTRE